MTRLLTIPEVADRLACKPQTVRRLIASGKLQCHRLTSRFYRVSETQLETFLRQHGEPAPSPEPVEVVDWIGE